MDPPCDASKSSSRGPPPPRQGRGPRRRRKRWAAPQAVEKKRGKKRKHKGLLFPGNGGGGSAANVAGAMSEAEASSTRFDRGRSAMRRRLDGARIRRGYRYLDSCSATGSRRSCTHVLHALTVTPSESPDSFTISVSSRVARLLMRARLYLSPTASTSSGSRSLTLTHSLTLLHSSLSQKIYICRPHTRTGPRGAALLPSQRGPSLLLSRALPSLLSLASFSSRRRLPPSLSLLPSSLSPPSVRLEHRPVAEGAVREVRRDRLPVLGELSSSIPSHSRAPASRAFRLGRRLEAEGDLQVLLRLGSTDAWNSRLEASRRAARRRRRSPPARRRCACGRRLPPVGCELDDHRALDELSSVSWCTANPVDCSV